MVTNTAVVSGDRLVVISVALATWLGCALVLRNAANTADFRARGHDPERSAKGPLGCHSKQDLVLIDQTTDVEPFAWCLWTHTANSRSDADD